MKSVNHRALFRFLQKAINVVLSVLLVAQSALLLCSIFDKKIPLPSFVAESISESLESEGVSVGFSSIHFGVDFSVILNDVHLRAHGTPSDFFKADKVKLGVNPIALLCSRNPIRYASIEGAEALHIFGYNKPVIKNINLMLSVDRDNYNLRLFKFRVHNLEFSASGKIEPDFSVKDIEGVFDLISEKFSSKKSEKRSVAFSFAEIMKQYDVVLEHIIAAKPYFEMFATPSVNLSFELLQGGRNFINLDLITPESKLVIENKECSFRNLNVKFCYDAVNEQEKFSTQAKVAEIQTPYKLSISNIEAKAGFNSDGKDVVLNDVDFSARQIKFDEAVLENVFLYKKLLSSASFKDGWRFFISRDKTSFGGTISLSDDNVIKSVFSGNIELDPIFALKEFSDIPEFKDFSFPHGIGLTGSATYKIGDTFPEVEARIELSDSVIMRIDIDSLIADVSMKDGILYCRDIKARSKEGWGASGNYIQNFKNYAYDIEVKGNLRPMVIAHFMEDWWTKVMGSFSFVDDKKMPYTDVRVEGAWGAPENIWCYGSVSGQDVLYNGAKFDDFSLLVWVNPTRITLYDIAILTGSGARSGKCFIEWLYDGDEGLDSYDKQRLVLLSNLNSAELIALGGDDAKEVLDVVKFENPPMLTLSALMFNPDNNPKKLNDIFNARIHALGKVSVEMIHLENATFSARSDKIDTDIFDAIFSFCGGDASGNVHLTRVDKTVLVDGNAVASKMNQGKFFEFLSSLGSSDSSKKEESSKEDMLGGASNGEVGATISLKGDVKNMARAQGKGEVNIDSKDFLKLNLFGAISKAFSSIGVPIGSFDIGKVTAKYELANGELKLSPVEMSGPALRIVGAAAYVLETDAIRGELKAYPFDKVDNQFISAVNTIVNPIMDTMRVTVGGTFEKPEFSAKISPIDVIRSEKNTIERIDKSL